MDRLPEIIYDLDASEADALVSISTRTSDPLGKPADVWCTHSGHRGRARHQVVGIQRWLLETHAWVPVRGDPLRRGIVSPGEAWVDVNGRVLKACLAQASLPKGLPAKLGLPSAARPDPQAAAQALITLRRAFPVLADARPDVQEGSKVILHRMEDAFLRRGGSTYRGQRPPFPAVEASKPVWSDGPAVADVATPENLPLPVLPPGAWPQLQRRFELPLVSDRVRITTKCVDPIPFAIDELDSLRRTQLAALLVAKGSDLPLIARRLGRLKTERCSEIRTTFEMRPGFKETHQEQAHLTTGAEEATLYVVLPLRGDSLAAVASHLASYLAVPEHKDLVLFFLALGEPWLRLNPIGNAAMDEARAAINRYVDLNSDEPDVEMDDDRGRNEPAKPNAQPSPDSAAHTGSTAPTPQRGSIGLPAIVSPGQVVPPRRLSFVTTSVQPSIPVPSGRHVTGARGGTGRSGAPSLSGAARREVEIAAIALAITYAREKMGCVEVNDVQEQNKGWDLEFVHPGGEWQPVEVKGFGQNAGLFILTRNELEAARRNENYLVLLVTGVKSETGQVIPLANPASWIAEDNLEPMSWEVDGWREHVQEIDTWTAHDTP